MKRTSQTKQTKTVHSVETEDKKYSSTIITNFLNNHYRNALFKDSPKQNITFKNYPKDANINNKFVIDLYKYQGLLDFIETYKLMLNEDYSKIIERVFDLKLRACLDIADKYKTNDKNKLNVFQEFIIPQLDFHEKREVSIHDFINAVSSFFENEDKLKTKIYNTVFPHATHKEDELPKGVNVIYLQHISKFHDDVLDMIINKNMNEEMILRKCQELYSVQYKFPDNKTVSPEERKRVISQILHPEIVKNILNPTTYVDENGKQAVVHNWINKLNICAFNKKKNTLEVTNERLNKDEKKIVRDLVRELTIVKSFIKIVRGGVNARKIIKEEVTEVDSNGNLVTIEKEKSVPVEADLKVCLEQYHKTYNEIRDFYEKWKNIIRDEFTRIRNAKERIIGTATNSEEAAKLSQEESDRMTYELFLRYFIESVKFVKSKLNYNMPLKTFINDIKKNIAFKFNKTLRTEIDEKIKQDGPISRDDIYELATKHYKDWMFINSPKTYNTNELDIYSKIGKFCGIPIKKDYRIAIGIAIIAYIQEQIKYIRASNNKKREILIYIKV